MTQYRDKTVEASKYRAILMLRNVALMLLVIIIAAALKPDMNQYFMCLLCLAAILITFFLHLRIDRTLIHTGQMIFDYGEDIIFAIGSWNIGFGRKHHQNKQIRNLHLYRLDKVTSLKLHPFGTAVRAVVQEGTTRELGIRPAFPDYDEKLPELLYESGKRNTVLFRIEKNILEDDEKKLLRRLQALMQEAPVKNGDFQTIERRNQKHASTET